MKIKLDISRVDFVNSKIVGFYDSKTIFFEPTNELPDTVSFKIWGADITNKLAWSDYIDIKEYPNIDKLLDANQNRGFAIQGFSEITFEKVVAGEIVIMPYDKSGFVTLNDGTNQSFKREWNIEEISEECFRYWLDTTIYFPYGACDLKLYTKGKVWFEFDPKDCVDYIEYVSDKKRSQTFWGYLKNKKLCTNSIKYKDIAPELDQ